MHPLYTQRSSLIRWFAVDAWDPPSLGAQLRVPCTLMNMHTETYILKYSFRKALLQWWREGQVCLPMTVPLSVCLHLWVLICISSDSHTAIHTHTLSHQWYLAGVALKLPRYKDIILVQSWVNFWTLTRGFFSSKEHYLIKICSWYRCTTLCS